MSEQTVFLMLATEASFSNFESLIQNIRAFVCIPNDLELSDITVLLRQDMPTSRFAASLSTKCESVVHFAAKSKSRESQTRCLKEMVAYITDKGGKGYCLAVWNGINHDIRDFAKTASDAHFVYRGVRFKPGDRNQLQMNL